MIRILKPEPGPVCGVFAITMTTPDVPFCMVKNMAQEEMRAKRWGGRMHMPAIRGLLDRLLVEYQEHSIVNGKSLIDAVKELDPEKHHLMFVTGHFLTLRGGKCYDQANAQGVPIENFWCKTRRVISILEITKFAPSYYEIFPEELEDQPQSA